MDVDEAVTSRRAGSEQLTVDERDRLVERGVRHHVALSVVGTERLSESGYFQAKIAQEKLIKGSSILHSIVHTTQFFEFLKQLADISFGGKKVRLPDALSKASCV
jgi:uncharacterized protein YbjT (DUF2867 family)